MYNFDIIKTTPFKVKKTFFCDDTRAILGLRSGVRLVVQHHIEIVFMSPNIFNYTSATNILVIMYNYFVALSWWF